MTRSDRATATLYMRGLPEPLVRRAKVAAARRGVTLKAIVADALQKVVEEEPVEEAADELEDDMRWYEVNKKRLLRRYEGQYVAIKGGKVVDADADFHALASRVFARMGRGSVLMPLVMREERVVRVASPSVVRA
jgi:plasmid stability protein